MNLLPLIEQAKKRLEGIVHCTPLERNTRLSERFGANIFLKREDLQNVRSYKIRGAYNTIAQISENVNTPTFVCASAGNHAQGVAYSCELLKVKGVIFMPQTTPLQKINQVRNFGKEFIEIRLEGDTFDDAAEAAQSYCLQIEAHFIHPFDDLRVIAGQGTVALELLNQHLSKIDLLLVPIGGGGLAAGICSVFKELSPTTRIIGIEPEGAPSMTLALEYGENRALDTVDKFVDGAAVKRVGTLNFELCRDQIEKMICVPEGKICTTILQLYNEEGMVVEPAGALTVSALSLLDPAELRNKNVVCVVSGGNNDVLRMNEIRERSLIHEGLKHYFMIDFPQRPGTLKKFVTEVLGPKDDITHFQFSQKNQRESGPAIVGIEISTKADFDQFSERLISNGFTYVYLNDNELLYRQLIG